MSEKLHSLLESKGISIYQLAKTINAPLTTVYQWFNGKSKPKLFYAEKLAKFFRVSIRYFL